MHRIILLLLTLSCLPSLAQAKDKLTLILDWFPNPNHAPLFVAEQQGLFAQENLDVHLIGPSDPSEPPRLVAAKKADLALTYQPQFMLQTAQGLPLTRIATLIATPLDCLLVIAKGDIKQLKDLTGKRIGYSAGGTYLVTLSAMLRQAGMSLKDVELINVHYNLSQALLTNKVDAITGVMRNVELTQLRLAGFTPKAFYPEDFGVPSYDELIVVTHRDNSQDPRLTRFLRALEKGTHYLINHPQQSWLLFAKQHPELNNPLNKQIWFDTLPRFALRPAAIDTTRDDNFARFLQTEHPK